MTDKELIKICLNEIIAKSGYPDVKVLRQRDLEYLCHEIEKRSGILISLSTLKRLLNDQFNSLPQIATLNAITLYLGYQNWQDFKVKKQAENRNLANESRPANSEESHPAHSEENRPADLTENPSAKNVRRRIPYRIIALGIGILALLVIIGSSNYFSSGRPKNSANRPKNGANVLFTAQKTTNNDIPNTVVFHYDIDNLAGDSFFIQQSWDRRRRVRIYKNNHTLTDIYYEPGYHNAKLIVNDSIIRTIGVSIPTDRWFFYSKEALGRGYPSYIQSKKPIQNGVLSLDPQDIVNSKIDDQKDQVYLYTFFPGKFEAEGDNFILRTRIRMKEVKNSACPFLMCEVFCQHNFMYFQTTLPGCTSNIDAQFGDHFMSGKTNDLSALGSDVRQWQDLEMVVKDRQATIYIGQREAFTKAYTSSAGLITGLGFISNGLCEIDSVDLKGLNGKVVYQNDFEH